LAFQTVFGFCLFKLAWCSLNLVLASCRPIVLVFELLLILLLARQCAFAAAMVVSYSALDSLVVPVLMRGVKKYFWHCFQKKLKIVQTSSPRIYIWPCLQASQSFFLSSPRSIMIVRVGFLRESCCLPRPRLLNGVSYLKSSFWCARG
jgi:hypothetical protein